MSAVVVELRSFPSPPGGWRNGIPGFAYVSMGRLMAAAATVGLTPWSLTPNGGPSVRSLDELRWRRYMLKANLESDGYRWVKSQSYLNLDPTEKGAVSYFHGMAQAGFVLDEVFGLPYTAHIDTCLLVMGQSLKESRPDLLAVKGNGYAAAAVECKGRTGTHNAAVIDRAKEQAQSLPKVLGCLQTTPIASIAHFDRSTGGWSSLMIDPDPSEDVPEIPLAAVVLAHYWPLVTLVNTMDRIETQGDRRWGTDTITGSRWVCRQ